MEQAQRPAVAVRPAAGARRRAGAPRRRPRPTAGAARGCPGRRRQRPPPRRVAGRAGASAPAPIASRSRSPPTSSAPRSTPTGGDLVRVELLNAASTRSTTWRKQRRAARPLGRAALYVAADRPRAAPAGGAGLPNHQTLMTLLPGERTLKAGAERAEGRVRVARSRRRQAGQDLHLQARRLRRSACSTRSSTRRRAPVSPQLYLQLVRDGNAPPGESSFYFTFTGPAIYTDSDASSRRSTSSASRSANGDKPDHDTSADNGWVAMVQHYFVSAWLVDKPTQPTPPREFFTGKVGTNTVLGRHARAARRRSRPARARPSTPRLFVGPQEENKLAGARARARAGQGLRLVHDPRQAAVLAADAAAQAARQLGLVDRRRWWCC